MDHWTNPHKQTVIIIVRMLLWMEKEMVLRSDVADVRSTNVQINARLGIKMLPAARLTIIT